VVGIYQLVFRQVGNAPDAEDLAAEVLMRTLRTLRFPAPVPEVRSYLVTTARTDGKPPADRKVFEEQARRALKFLNYAPILFVSAASGKNADKIFTAIQRVTEQRFKRITTGQMNRFLKHVDFERAAVPMAKRVRIYYLTQTNVAPPTFILFTDRDVKLHFSYERFLENQIRDAFGFAGTPIWIKTRPKEKKQ